MYDRGFGTERNTDLARHWYTAAAEKGQLNAQYALGMQYFNRFGRVAGTEESLQWPKTAAKHGDAQAQYMVASLYTDDATDASLSTHANDLFEQAAAQGHIYASGLLSP